MPRPHDEENFVIVGVLWLDGFVDGNRAVYVFLIPQAVDEHGWNFQRLCGKNLVHGLLLPPRIVAGMLEDFAPETDLLEPVNASEFPRRTGRHVFIVVIEVADPPFGFVVAR